MAINGTVLTNSASYDVAIIGGGVAGLCLSIQLTKAGFKVILFEKERYPFHKVCGEYVSMESWDFLERLGLPLSHWSLPKISRLLLTSPSGTDIRRRLPLGGFGISRYKLDSALATLAQNTGVIVMQATKVDNILSHEGYSEVQCGDLHYNARLVCGTFGKRSNLDIKLNRDFIKDKPGKSHNYVAVKYHIKTDSPTDTIALHNFNNGYCGLSRIEDEKYCLCYMTTAKNLSWNGHSIDRLEKEILQKNPYLEKIFSSSTFLYPSPLTISQVNFQDKTQIENHILLSGDAAGMIPPLSGNGMSMAMHGSKIAFQQIRLFLENHISREDMNAAYQLNWNAAFRQRIITGRFIQQLLGREWFTDCFFRTIRPFPAVTDRLIRKTHGVGF